MSFNCNINRKQSGLLLFKSIQTVNETIEANNGTIVANNGTIVAKNETIVANNETIKAKDEIFDVNYGNIYTKTDMTNCIDELVDATIKKVESDKITNADITKTKAIIALVLAITEFIDKTKTKAIIATTIIKTEENNKNFNDANIELAKAYMQINKYKQTIQKYEKDYEEINIKADNAMKIAIDAKERADDYNLIIVQASQLIKNLESNV